MKNSVSTGARSSGDTPRHMPFMTRSEPFGSDLAALTVAEAKPKRQRKPTTDPVQLERRRAALAKARAARAEKLAAARVGGDGSGGEG